MMPPDRHDASRDTRIAEEKSALRRCRNRDRLFSFLKARPSILGIGRRRLNIPAQAEIQRETGEDSEIILHKEARTPAIGVTGHGSVPRYRGRKAHYAVGDSATRDSRSRHGIFYVRSVESKYPVII